MNNNLTVGLIVVVALLGGFYGGFRYESSKVTTATAAATSTPGTGTGAGRTGPGGGGGFAGGGGGVTGGGGGFGGRGNAGTVTNLTSTGFTLHNATTGTDTKVTFAPTATIRKTVAGQLSDITASATVQVTGTRDANGNLLATTITLIPLPTASPSAGG